jgi:predicted unusual protein kinase regulating ubiquinone biosynthesis (AarF/ABC1/UbiB family)
MAFWHEDGQFLTDVTLMLSGPFDASKLNMAGLQSEIGALMAKYRRAALAEMQVGLILQEMSEIAVSYGVPLPASLTLVAKALAQVQLATAQLDPMLDPFEVAGRFLMLELLKGIRSKFDPKTLLYESQKLRVRAVRMVDTFERLMGARPGQNLQISFLSRSLEDMVRQTGRRLTTGLITAACVFAAGLTAASTAAPNWAPIAFGGAAGLLTLGLIIDMTRPQ